MGASDGEEQDPKEEGGGEPTPGFWAIAGYSKDPLQDAIC